MMAVMSVTLNLLTKINSHQKLQYLKIYNRRYVYTAQFAIILWCCGQQSRVNSKVRDFGDVLSIQTAGEPQALAGVSFKHVDKIRNRFTVPCCHRTGLSSITWRYRPWVFRQAEHFPSKHHWDTGGRVVSVDQPHPFWFSAEGPTVHFQTASLPFIFRNQRDLFPDSLCGTGKRMMMWLYKPVLKGQYLIENDHPSLFA